MGGWHRVVLHGWAQTTGLAGMSHRPMRGYRMFRQMTAMIHHDPVQFVPSTENVFPMVAVRIEMPMSHAVRPNHPEVGVAADEHHVAVDDPGDVDVARHRLIGLFDDHRRWRWGRRECVRQNFIDLVRIDHELALLVGGAPRNSRGTGDRCEGNS